jgi:hypothetical protein
MTPPRVIDRHGVVTTVIDVDEGNAYIYTRLMSKETGERVPTMWFLDDPPGLQNTEDEAILYCRRGKHNVTVPLEGLPDAVARYRRGESQVRVFAAAPFGGRSVVLSSAS